MDKQYQIPTSHLFTVRLWQEDLGDGQSEWRGKLQNVHSGEVSYFRDWQMLVRLLLRMLPEAETQSEID